MTAKRVTVELSRDGVSKGYQVSINAYEGDGPSGHGYRIFGPKFNGTGDLIKSETLSKRDAEEIRAYCDLLLAEEPKPEGQARVDVEAERDCLRAELAEAKRCLRLTGDARDRAQAQRDDYMSDLALKIRERDVAREEAARKGADADRSWRLLADARTAAKRLTAGLIANASLLDVPFTNEPELSPWSRSIKPAIDQLRVALGMRGAMRLPCCDLHNRNCEPPSELCCEQCTEVAHPGHADGSACIAPDLISPPLAAVDALGTPTPSEEGGSIGITGHWPIFGIPTRGKEGHNDG